jgi:fatty acid desaturase/RNA polymerase-interacting CarD/CdnL/TRCF family regulator
MLACMYAASDLRALRSELTESGVFARHSARTATKLVILLAALAGMLGLVALLPWWCAVVLVPLAAIPAVTAAMIGHEAAHGSFAASRTVNDVVLYLVFPLFGGLGALHWKHKHNHLHHGHPNVVGRDPDINAWPMAMSSLEHAASGPVRRWLQRTLQGYLFWPLTTLLAFSMRYDSLRYLVQRVGAGQIDRAVLLDAGCLLAHYTLWLAIPMLWFGVWPVLLVYTGLWAVGGVLLALVFAPAHMGLPLASADERGGWHQQLAGTRNLKMPRWLSFFFVGLDFQVEHHLFPRIPHQNLARASRIVGPWCARVGAPYHSLDYGSSLRQVTRHVRLSWQIGPEVAVESSMPRTLQKLTVGSRVFYPGHGVVSVKSIEERAFGGAMQCYYLLELELDPSAKLMVPVDKVSQAGLRAIISPSKARALMKAVAEEAELPELKSDPGSRKQRATGYGEALRSGSADRYTATLRELLTRLRSSKLSAGEQQVLQQALAMFVDEMSAALDRPRDEVKADLRTIAELPAVGW